MYTTDDVMNQNFLDTSLNEKWTTDITELRYDITLNIHRSYQPSFIYMTLTCFHSTSAKQKQFQQL